MVAVVSRVPLFIEALRAAFEGIADLQSVSLDDVEAHGLVRAFRPDVVIVEGEEMGEFEVPCVRVDLVANCVSIRNDGHWERLEIELSPTAIRNVAVAALYGGALK